MTGALLEEGLRGAGGHLRNGRGERYMARYDASRMERSTRDLVSRASFLEIAEGRGTPNGGVWIDVSHLGAEVVERNFRGMVRRCRDFGRDLARQPVEVGPIGPTAHFMMGGVVIDPTCRTAVEGLFAAGEDAGGVHGANRLGGNGVADSTVFGGIAGDVIARAIGERPPSPPSAAALAAAAAACTAPLGRLPTADLYTLQRELRELMWDDVGLVRDGAGLARATTTLDRLAGDADRVGLPPGRALSLAWQDWLNLRNQIVTARLIVASALERRESRGAHYRRDFPEPERGRPYAVHVRRQGDGAPAVWREAVACTRAAPPPDPRSPSPLEIGD
jgi:succinate dehydrogenase/fumarate reductase flavoprotein subunit